VLSAVVLDVRLPDGDGVDLLVAVRDDSVLHDLPVVVLSTEAEIEDRLRGLRSGANDYFGKPYHTDLLVTRIAQLVDEHRRIRAQITLSELDARVARAEAEAATQRATVAEERAQLAEQLARTNLELAQTNRELEAFGYSVSHDLRAPLRAIREFTQALVEDAGAGLDPRAKDHARRVLAATARMSQLIDALLELSRVHRAPITRHRVDMTAISEVIGDELARRDPDRRVALVVAPELVVRADARLVRLLLDNLLGNAWKFTARTADAKISVGVDRNASTPIYWVRDNGAGFDLARADRMFTPFHRLHSDTEFSGTGIGLATWSARVLHSTSPCPTTRALLYPRECSGLFGVGKTSSTSRR